ncbi:SH3 domain-containing protein [Powellomyces hirtus]|nr:SH3 domain-containing protein [Powellomyces hirtus]
MAAAAVDSSSSQIQQQEQQQPPERLDHPRQRQSPSTPGPRPVSGAQPLYARAIWDYIAIEDNELSFVVGDIIEVLDRCNTDWYEGRLANEGSRDGNSQFVGYFPATRVWIIEVCWCASFRQAGPRRLVDIAGEGRNASFAGQPP